MRIRKWVLAVIAVSSLAPAVPAAGRDPQEFSLRVGATTRWTLVYEPVNYRVGAPVVLLLHGGGQSMHKMFERHAGGTAYWRTLADREGFLLLVPNATNARDGDTHGTRQNWNDLRAPTAKAKTSADDVSFLLALLDWAQTRYGYDRQRVYVTGASNGGMMTMRLLIEHPERFTAAAAFIASLPKDAPPVPPPGPRVPLLLFNGTKDPLVQWQGGMIKGERGETMAIETMVQWWQVVNRVQTVRAQVESLPDTDPKDGCRLTRTRWPSDADAPLVFVRADGGGHALPSVAHPLHLGPLLRHLIGPDCHDVEGATLAWEFFREFLRRP